MPPLTVRPGPNVLGWRVFAVVLMLALTVPRLWQRGMFLDGMTYAVVARNMAEGTSTRFVPSRPPGRPSAPVRLRPMTGD